MKNNIFDALGFANEAHRDHFRKGTKVPYITHLCNVMKILLEKGYAEEVAIAGLLHDTVEDTKITIGEIEDRFGKQIMEWVKGATEPDKLLLKEGEEEAPWQKRKEHTISDIKNVNEEEILAIACADKLDNIRAIKADLDIMGDALWSRFNAPYEDQRWYYTSLSKEFNKRQPEFGRNFKMLTNDFEAKVREVFQME